MEQQRKVKVLLLDAANTIIHKPALWENYISVLTDFGYCVSEIELRKKHKMISEIIHFPDRTSVSFYRQFNSEVLLSLGIIPVDDLIEAIFKACTYLPWETFNDTQILNKIPLRKAILSNFNSGLGKKIDSLFGASLFEIVIASEEAGIGKPEVGFYEYAVQALGVSPAEILYVGDSLKLDVIPASSIGIQSWLIDRDNNFTHFSNRLNSLNELANVIEL